MTGFTVFVIEIRGNVAQLLGGWIEYNYYTISIKDNLNKSCSSYKVRNSKQGSHSSWKTWKTWKNGDSFSSLEKSWNFVIFAKYPGK